MRKLDELDELHERLDKLIIELQTAKDRIGSAMLFLAFNAIALIAIILGVFDATT